MRIENHPTMFKVSIIIEDQVEFQRLMTLLNFASHSLDATRYVNEFAANLKSQLQQVYEYDNPDESQ